MSDPYFWRNLVIFEQGLAATSVQLRPTLPWKISSTSSTSSLAASWFWYAIITSDHSGEAGRANLLLRQLERLLISTTNITNTTTLTATSSLLQLRLQGSLWGLWKVLLPLCRQHWLLLLAWRIWLWSTMLCNCERNVMYSPGLDTHEQSYPNEQKASLCNRIFSSNSIVQCWMSRCCTLRTIHPNKYW